LYCLFFDLWLLITSLASSKCSFFLQKQYITQLLLSSCWRKRSNQINGWAWQTCNFTHKLGLAAILCRDVL
jgi:hypothetical protein